MKSREFLQGMNPFVLFWLGILTGALVILFAMLYRVMNTVDYQSSILRLFRWNDSKGVVELNLQDYSVQSGSFVNQLGGGTGVVD